MKNKFKPEVFVRFMKAHNLSKREFCKLCNIGFSTLNKILTGDMKFKTTELFKLKKQQIFKFGKCLRLNKKNHTMWFNFLVKYFVVIRHLLYRLNSIF